MCLSGNIFATSLYVDLDGTLLKSDVLFESFFALCKKNLFLAFKSIFFLLFGKSSFKHYIAQHVDIDAKYLPFYQDFVQYLHEQKHKKRRLILATASNEKFAYQIAAHFGFFDDVISSSAIRNIAGKEKLKIIMEHCQGDKFAYAGNGKIDVPIWEKAESAIMVNVPKSVSDEIKRRVLIEKQFYFPQNGLRSILKAARLYQWVKNILLFVPVITSHKLTDLQIVGHSLIAFVAFSLCSSSVYLLNDLLDLQADREHPLKCHRPLASGSVSLQAAALMIVLLSFSFLAVSMTISIEFTATLLVYYSLSIIYSKFFKNIVLIDVLVLSFLYIIRVIAGAVAADINLSFWLLAFSMFIFLSLALVKRSTEIILIKKQDNPDKKNARDYELGDLSCINSMGISSGYLSVLVMALYINSQEVMLLYKTPEILWLICPILLCWINRMWLLASRGDMHDDPILFTIKDKYSYIIGVLLSIIIIAAIF